MKIHQVDYAFLKLCDELPTEEQKQSLKVNFNPISISKFNLPKKYVVLTTGYTVGVREFKADSVNKIISFVKSKGYTPVFLGSEKTATGAKHVIKGVFDDKVTYHSGLKLINQTTLLEAAKIMQGAKAVVGVDNGLLHVAGCTDTNIVAGYTTVAPQFRAPYRATNGVWMAVVPEESLACRFCQSNTNFLYGVDYTKCFEKDLLCVKQMTADKFIAALEHIL
jgi:ADP-heptose:LPS heptosyltransferase